MNDHETLEFFEWCKKNGTLNGLRYRSEAGQSGCICSFPKRDTFGLRVGHRIMGVSLQELVRNARKGFDQKGLGELYNVMTVFQKQLRSVRQTETALPTPTVSKREFEPKSSRKPKLEELVAKYAGLLGTDSKRSIPQFLEQIEMPFLEGSDFVSDLSNLRERFPLSKGPLVHRPFEKAPVPQKIVASLAGRLREAEKNWRRDLGSGDIKIRLRYINYLSQEQKHDLLVDVAKSNLWSADASRKIFGLYDENFDLLVTIDPSSFGPSVFGYAVGLVERSSTSRALQLVSILNESDPGQYQQLMEFLKFLVTPRPCLQGVTPFDELTPSDLFLAACYYPKDRPAKGILEGIKDWRLSNIRDNLEEREWRDFLVSGLQPRVAEVAFGRILKILYQDEEASDLNLIAMGGSRLGYPGEIRLPPADWQTVQGDQIDVKSNVFFRSKTQHLGLRGLLINRPDREDVRWAGFVFHGSSDHDCSWSYMGTMSRRCLEEGLGDCSLAGRVLPFLFSLPEELRWTRKVPEDQADEAAKLIAEPDPLLAWCLASSALCRSAWTKHREQEKIVVRFLEVFLKQASDLPLEFRLWRSLTEHSINECAAGRSGDVEVLLGLFGRMLSSATDPLRLPRIGNGYETLLHRWCTEVLEPLGENFQKVVCPGCDGRNFSLAVSRITGSGAIFGRMVCLNGCDLGSGEITVLTHCHKCKAYPMILGGNQLCSECRGLICRNEHEKGQVCSACKKRCSRQTQESGGGDSRRDRCG